jgi:DNA-binding transcriptional LysR family regulator
MNHQNSSKLFVAGRRLRVDFRQLQHVVTAAEYGSFRQAADILSIKQSTLSRSVQILEHSFGIVIFDRSSGGVRATAAGRHFLRTARSMIEQMEALAATARSSGRGESGRLVVGFCTSLTAGNLRATLLDFRRRFPQVELGTVERSRTRLGTALRNGATDINVTIGEPLVLDSKMVPLWSERILAILPQDHPLVQQEIVYWTDLRNEVVLLSQYDHEAEFEEVLNAKFTLSAIRPKIERQDVSRGAIKSLISMGLGISLVLESDLGANFVGLTYREVQDGTGPSRIGFWARWHPDNENPALAHFLKLLSERYPPPS